MNDSESQEQVLRQWKVDPKKGLSSEEIEKRRAQYGLNQLKGKAKPSFLLLFLLQLKDMLIYILLGATVITLIIGEYVDAAVILCVVFLNALIGVIQEHKAEKAIEALQQLTSPHAVVRRNGDTIEIESQAIVPGDIVILDAGRYVPADLRLIESANLQIEESALTGESVPSDKDATSTLESDSTSLGDRANMAFMSTLVTYGRGEGVVVATGMNTEIGKIATSLDDAKQEMTPLQKKLNELGKMLGYIAIAICLLIFVIALFQKRDFFEMFLTAISLAVAAIPEGLPAIVAIVLALGVTRMSKKNAIVKKLPAVETLGSVNIICSDKTGTLTQNKMTVVQMYTLDQTVDVENLAADDLPQDSKQLVQTFALCSDASYDKGQSTGDPTEVALVILADQFGLDKKTLEAAHPRISENPFDSDRKLMSTLNKAEQGYQVHTKGAIDQLLPLCTSILNDGEVIPITEDHKQSILNISNAMSDEALRVLAAAFKNVNDDDIAPEQMEQDLTLIGLVGMIDPPRLEVKDSILQAKKAGIMSVMITGDHQKTAVAIAKQLDIAESIEQSITGAELDVLSDEVFAERIQQYRVFARVSPEHKVRIVKAFQSHDLVVSMTGDGVNDAPSLKRADIGVAMGITGTDVSKGASDMILTDDNFTTIVHAIEEGRNIYQNIKKSVIFLLSCNLGEVITVLVSILFFWPVPLLPTQILWVNLVTDTMPAIALGLDPKDKDIMKNKPRNPKESFFAHGAGVRAILGGVLIGIMTLTAFYLGLKEFGYSLGSGAIDDDALTYARTMAFVVLAASQLLYALTMRSATKSIFQVGLFTNKYLIGAIIMGFILQYSAISIPFLATAFKVQNLSLPDWGIVFALALVPLIVNEGIKWMMRRTGRA